MIRIPGKIPITITTGFWIFAAIIGFLNSMGLLGTLIWVGIIFISVLFHELGHAFTALLFGQKPHVELVAMGGMTIYNPENLSFWKQFIIVFNGPLFGFLLFVAASLLLQIPGYEQGFIGEILLSIKWVNLFWTVLNLLPIMPLDGGQLLRIPLEAFFGFKGLKYALFISMIIAFGISLAAFLFQFFLVGAILFFFAFQSFDSWKKSRQFSEPDQDISLKELLKKGELALEEGNKEEAKSYFQELRLKSTKGTSHLLASQYLAFLEYEKGNLKEVYHLLFPIKEKISLDTLCILHRAAFAESNFSLVEALSGSCFQQMPTAETALRNSYAAAALKKTTAALGWLDAAISAGLQDLASILSNPYFDPIRTDPLFQSYQQRSL